MLKKIFELFRRIDPSVSEKSKTKRRSAPLPTQRGDEPSEKRAAVDRYFSLVQTIEDSIRDSDFDRAVTAGRESLNLLRAVVQERTFLHKGKLLIQHIPAIDDVGVLCACRRDDESLNAMADAVRDLPELKPWVRIVDGFIDDARIVGRILELIHTAPGSIQKDLGKTIGVDGMRVRNLIYWLDRTGAVTRKKSGKSYALYPAVDKSPS